MSANKVLVVDDSLVDLTYLKGIVEQTGVRVITTSDGEEAFYVAKLNKPDLIFMDIVMSGVDGYEACRRIRDDKDTQGIPVVFVTGKNQKVDAVWAKIQGAKALIAKPYKRDAIIAAIKSI